MCALMTVVVQGLDVGNCDIMLHVRVCEGLVRQLDGSIEKRFARKELLYPIQVPKQSRHPTFAGRSFSGKAKPQVQVHVMKQVLCCCLPLILRPEHCRLSWPDSR